MHSRLCFNTHPAARCYCVVTRPRPLGCWGTHTDTALPAERCRCVNKAGTCQAQGPGPSPMKCPPSHDPGHRGLQGTEGEKAAVTTSFQLLKKSEQRLKCWPFCVGHRTGLVFLSSSSFFFFLATLGGLWDLSSLTSD